MEKGMQGYVCEDVTVPADTTEEKRVELLDTWQMNNAKIITWINNAVVIDHYCATCKVFYIQRSLGSFSNVVYEI